MTQQILGRAFTAYTLRLLNEEREKQKPWSAFVQLALISY